MGLARGGTRDILGQTKGGITIWKKGKTKRSVQRRGMSIQFLPSEDWIVDFDARTVADHMAKQAAIRIGKAIQSGVAPNTGAPRPKFKGRAIGFDTGVLAFGLKVRTKGNRARGVATIRAPASRVKWLQAEARRRKKGGGGNRRGTVGRSDKNKVSTAGQRGRKGGVRNVGSRRRVKRTGNRRYIVLGGNVDSALEKGLREWLLLALDGKVRKFSG